MSDPSTPPQQGRDLAALALSHALIARKDIRASWILYKREVYPQSVYFFQQGVEKYAKAVGLLTGTLRPTDWEFRRGVGHMSLLALLLRLPEMLDVNALVAPIAKEGLARASNHPTLRGTGVDQLVVTLGKNIKIEPSRSKEARAMILKIRAMDKSRLWAKSLNLDPRDEFTKNIFRLFEDAKVKVKQADEAEALMPLISKLLMSILKIPKYKPNYNLSRYLLNIQGRASPLLIPLTLVSMGHESETRYPPLLRTGYWSPDAYTPDKGLIKHFPEFIGLTREVGEATMAGATAANKGFD